MKLFCANGMNMTNIFTVLVSVMLTKSQCEAFLITNVHSSHLKRYYLHPIFLHFITIIRWITALSLWCELLSIMQPSFNYCILWKYLLMNCETTVLWCDCTGQQPATVHLGTFFQLDKCGGVFFLLLVIKHIWCKEVHLTLSQRCFCSCC